MFGLPELGLGLIPGAGGTVSVTRRIGRWRTAYLVLSGRTIDAETALAWGWWTRSGGSSETRESVAGRWSWYGYGCRMTDDSTANMTNARASIADHYGDGARRSRR